MPNCANPSIYCDEKDNNYRVLLTNRNRAGRVRRWRYGGRFNFACTIYIGRLVSSSVLHATVVALASSLVVVGLTGQPETRQQDPPDGKGIRYTCTPQSSRSLVEIRVTIRPLNKLLSITIWKDGYYSIG